MTERDAEDRARDLNADLGRSGVTNAYYTVVQVAPDQWDVQRVDEPPMGKLRALLDSFFDHPF